MKLVFLCVSEGLVDNTTHDAIARQIVDSVFARVCDNNTPPDVRLDDHGRLELRFQFSSCAHASENETRNLFVEIIECLANYSERYGVDWNLGHQLEPHLGRIVAALPDAELLDELETSLRVAHSFQGMIIDDEFVDSAGEITETDEGETMRVREDESWTELFDVPERFTKFPELE